MDGLLIVDKPEGLTSHDVVARVRRILKTKRVGHTGTLDPFATGVLVLLIGKATRLAQFLDKDEKEYEAVIRFGYETDTGDKTGKPKIENAAPQPIDISDLKKLLPEFIGEIEQIPPMYSAKKIEGKKLYELAREGKSVERKPVKVTISELESLDVDETMSDVRIRVVCSAGTYIRTLAEDIGKRLDVGAHLQELRRSRAGQFGLGDSVTIESLAECNDPTHFMMPIEKAVSHLPRFTLSSDRVEKTRNGLATRTSDVAFSENENVRMVDNDERLVAIGTYEAIGSQIRPKIVVA